ncbi:type II toxin-antitoxin system YafO family toxin [Pseudomonas sp. SMV7]|uniref:type II toxin-antitoxin system YafO family toxin n=1 Tax=Pseudomonas sp. SMV7 TaxID=3390194 RepID=UPI003F878DFA
MEPITAVYHPETYAEFFSQPLKDFPSLADNLLADFINYKSGRGLPSYFGCDVPYTQPHLAYTAQLMHIHLQLPPHAFPEGVPQFDRKCKKGQPQNDAALVYVRGELEENRYCILGVLHPDAHAKARSEKIMRYLARLAKKFRDEN